MRVMTAGLIAAIASIYSAVSLADCARPRPAFEIPDGRTATEQALVAVRQPLVAYADEVREYLRCLNGEASQKAIGKDTARRAELAKAHIAAHDAAANEITGLVSCYQAQLDIFKHSDKDSDKSSSGGTLKPPADCSSYIEAAANRGASAAPATSEVIVEASGHTFDIPGGSWLYYLVRDDSTRPCAQPAATECLYRAVLVRNDSDDELECNGRITYAGTDSHGNATTQSKALVAERATDVVVGSLAPVGIDAQTFEAQCTPRAKLPPLDTPSDCKYQVVQPVAISDYYPDASRQAGEEGPVVVEFTLAGKAAHPTNVRVVAGSLYEGLDQAAVKAIGDMVMSSTCPKTRYRLKLSFRLEQ